MAPMGDMRNAVVSQDGRISGSAGKLSEIAVMQARLIARSLKASMNAESRSRDARGRFMAGPGATSATGNVVALEARRANQAQIQQVEVLGRIEKHSKAQLDVLNDILKEQIKTGKVIAKHFSSSLNTSLTSILGKIFGKLWGGAARLGSGALGLLGMGAGAVGGVGRAALARVLSGGGAVIGSIAGAPSSIARAGSTAMRNMGAVAGALGTLVSSSAGSMLAKYGPKIMAGARFLPGVGALIAGLAAAYQGLSGWNRAAELLGRDLDPKEWRGRIAGAIGGIIGSIPFFDEAKVAKWVDEAIGGASNLMSRAKDNLTAFLEAPVDAIAKLSIAVKDYVTEGFQSAKAKVSEFISTDFQAIAVSVKDWMGGMVSKITEGFKNFFSYINPFKGMFGGDSDAAPSPVARRAGVSNEVAAAAASSGVAGATAFVSPASMARAQSRTFEAIEDGAESGVYRGLKRFFSDGNAPALLNRSSELPDPFVRPGAAGAAGGGGGGLGGGASPGGGAGGAAGSPSVPGNSGWRIPFDPRGLAGRAKALAGAIASGDTGAITRELSRGELRYKSQSGSSNGNAWGGSRSPIPGASGGGIGAPSGPGGGAPPAGMPTIPAPSGGGQSGGGYNPGAEPGGMGGVGPTGPAGASGGYRVTNESIQRELQDPQIRARLASLAHNEIGASGSPEDAQKFMETVRNRAMARGKTLDQIMQPGYYPPQSFKAVKPETQARYASGIDSVAGGSNLANFATDNASDQKGNPVKSRRLQRGLGPDKTGIGGFSSTGEELFYSDKQYQGWAQEQKAAAARAGAGGTATMSAPNLSPKMFDGTSERLAFDTDNNYTPSQVQKMMRDAAAQGIAPGNVTIGYNPQNAGFETTEAAIDAAGAKRHMYFGGPGDPSWKPIAGGETNDQYLAEMAKHGGWDKFMEGHLARSNTKTYEIDTMDTMPREQRMQWLREHFGRLDAAGNTSKWLPKNATPDDLKAYMADPVIANRLQMDKDLKGGMFPRSIVESDTPYGVGSIRTLDTQRYKTNGLVGVGDMRAKIATGGQDPNKIIADAAQGKISPASAAVDHAMTQLGLHEQRDKTALQTYLRDGGQSVNPASTAWCAGFVNASLDKAGVQGSGSLVANSFQRWGGDAGRDASAWQKGDVLVKHNGLGPGQTGGHVGMFTGNTRVNKNGQMEVEMISGNQGDKVQKTWENPSALMARRAAAQAQAGRSPADGMPGGLVTGAGAQTSLQGRNQTPVPANFGSTLAAQTPGAMNNRGAQTLMPGQSANPSLAPSIAGANGINGAMGGVSMPTNPTGTVQPATPEAAPGGGEINQQSPPPPPNPAPETQPPADMTPKEERASLDFGVNDIRNNDTAELLMVNQSMLI